ncbi:NADH-FMN oxidoreductase [Minicystis rosea]|nr:NADH-FMN oxidoreductase [Minicystis rosea]
MQTFSPSSIDSYKALARAWAATVTVVTVRRAPEHVAAGAPELDGFTATAFLTISMSPPIIAISATASSSAFAMMREAKAFAVNLLAPGHAELASAFAKPAAERVGLWDRVGWAPDADAVPLLSDTAGAFSARTRQLVEAGDHVLVLGDVTAIHVGEATDTLIYHNRGYGRVERIG